MFNKQNPIDALMEQLAIDELINKLDRDLFFPRKRVTLMEFLDNIKNLKAKIDRQNGNSVTVEFNYEINWGAIIPERVIKLNPWVSQNYENPVLLRTTFYSDVIKNQELIFRNATAMELLFEVFSANSSWELRKDSYGTERLYSKDDKFVVSILHSKVEDDSSLSSNQFLLLYKG